MAGFFFFVFLVSIAIIVYRIMYADNKKIEPKLYHPSPQQDRADYGVTITIEKDTTPRLFEPTRENKQIMKALVFIGKADGQLRENECEVIAEYLKSVQPEHETTPTVVIGWQVRDMDRIEYIDYKKILNNMSKSQAETFLMWANRVVNTQDKVHPFEEVLLDNIKEHIASVSN